MTEYVIKTYKNLLEAIMDKQRLAEDFALDVYIRRQYKKGGWRLFGGSIPDTERAQRLL